MGYVLIILAILASGGRVETTITLIPSMAECQAIAGYLVGEIERRGGQVTKAECR